VTEFEYKLSKGRTGQVTKKIPET